MITKEKAIDILDKFDFFQGQRAGRELWNDKPFDVQEQDISNFSKNVALLKEYIISTNSEINRLKKYDAERDIKLHAGLISRTEEKIASALSSEIARYFNKEISFYKDQHFAASLGYDKERCRYCEHIISKLEQHKQHFAELLKKYTEGEG